jgi:hypothetical protein
MLSCVRWLSAAFIALAFILMHCGPVSAADEAPKPPRFEAYGGALYGGVSAASYSTLVWSPLGTIDAPGPRLRTESVTSLFGSGGVPIHDKRFRLKGLRTQTSVTAGYAGDVSDIWLKGYAGVSCRNDVRVWFGVRVALRQDEGCAPHVVGEAWRRLNDKAWVSAFASWEGVENARALQVKAAHVLTGFPAGGTWSAGMEASHFTQQLPMHGTRGRTRDSAYTSGGAFLNLASGKHDVTLSGGIGEKDADRSPYVALTYGRRF